MPGVAPRVARTAQSQEGWRASCAMYFSAAASSENDHGSTVQQTGAVFESKFIVYGRRHPTQDRVAEPTADVLKGVASVALVPQPVQ
jgi:hypothetical protein